MPRFHPDPDDLQEVQEEVRQQPTTVEIIEAVAKEAHFRISLETAQRLQAQNEHRRKPQDAIGIAREFACEMNERDFAAHLAESYGPDDGDMFFDGAYS